MVVEGGVTPLAHLASWAWFHGGDIDSRLIGVVGRALLVAGMAAGRLTVVGVLLAWLLRQDGRRGTRMLGRLATAGYAIPGTVLAVALFVPLAGLSEWLSTTLSGWSSSTIRIALHAGLATLLLGYGARFLTVATHPIEGQLMRVSPAMEDVARSLGSSTWDMPRSCL